MKKTIASGVSALLLIGGLAFAPAAFADDESSPTQDTTVTQTTEDTTPVVEETQPPVEEPAPSEKPTVESKTIDPSNPPVEKFKPYETSARWLLPASWDYNTTPTYQAAIFPQDVLTGYIPCGRWSQDDVYSIKSKADEKLFESLDDDGKLTQGEDGSIYKSHVFTQGPKCETPPPVINECTEGQSTHSTNLNNLWSDVDTRSAGHWEYIEDGLHVWTDDNSSNAKVSLGQAISFPLHDTGVLDIQWDGSTPPPGLNLFVNFGADGSGTLVYESVYGQDLWLTNGSSAAVKANAPVNGGGNGSEWHGTIDQWLSVYPDATVTGIAFSLGSGVKGDGVISSITVGCGVHTFDYQRPAQPEPKTRTEHLEDLASCTDHDVTITDRSFETDFEWNGESWTLGEEKLVNTKTTTRAATNEDFDAIDCGIVPGDIQAVCVSDIPYLAYSVDAPQEGPLTITFENPDGPDYVVENAPRSGSVLWPGASVNPDNWPGWVLNPDGSYSETDGNFAWTREGVTVSFDINPHYETFVKYPEATSTCANPPVTEKPPVTPSLAQTGGGDVLPWSLAGLALMLAGISGLAIRKYVTK